MTRKNYVAIARAIKSATKLNYSEKAESGSEYIVDKDILLDGLIDMFQADNVLFDADKFVEACK